MKYDVEIQLRVKHRQVDFGGFLPGNWEEIDPNRKHPAVILLAGGAYWRRSSREKEPVALKLLGYGISPWILEYSVAPETFPQSLCEVLTAVEWLREHSGEYRIDGENISVCGFSAGGHLAASAGCLWDRDFIQEMLGDPGDLVRPDKVALCYPVITAGPYAHLESIRCLLGDKAEDETCRRLVSLEHQVGAGMPPVFLWHTAEDASVPVQNSLLFAMAVAAQGKELELHIYPHGRHGLSTGDFTANAGLEPGDAYGCAGWVEKAAAFFCGTGKK